MRAPTTLSPTLLVLMLFATSCATPTDPSNTEKPANEQEPPSAPSKEDGSQEGEKGSGDEATTNTTIPEGAKVLCNLDCSGSQAKGYGVDEAAARADVTKHVKDLCNPDDGQYFVFCEPIK